MEGLHRYVLCFCGCALWLLSACASSSQPGWAQAPLHAQPPPGAWHVVKDGETVVTLAARTGVPTDDFREINGLAKGQEPRPGQVVFMLAPDPKRIDPDRSVANVTRAEPATVTATEHRPTQRDESRFAWPLARPVVSSVFGTRWGRNHEGIDLAAPLGTAVFAADDGVVIYSDNLLSGYGNMIIIDHSAGLLTAYAHASVLMVHRGDRVRRAQPVARVGQSGRATSPHLHFEVRVGDEPRDPLQYLPPLPGR